jgi:hypothetical protein
MSVGDKSTILAQVENQFRGKRQALTALGIPKSSYYSGVSGKPIRETAEDLGTGSLPLKKTGYWRSAGSFLNSAVGSSQSGSPITKALPYPSQQCTEF